MWNDQAYPINVGSDKGDVDHWKSRECAGLNLADVAINHRDREARRENVGRELRYRADSLQLQCNKKKMNLWYIFYEKQLDRLMLELSFIYLQ